MFAVLTSALHALSLGIGLGAVFSRGLALRALAAGDAGAIRRILLADSFWALAAVLWILTGVTRLFGQLDKGLDFYLYNGFFWIKITLFGSIVALEVAPMISFIRWRAALRGGKPVDTRRAPVLARINDAETVLVVLIPFVAAAMARGLWLLP